MTRPVCLVLPPRKNNVRTRRGAKAPSSSAALGTALASRAASSQP